MKGHNKTLEIMDTRVDAELAALNSRAARQRVQQLRVKESTKATLMPEPSWS